MPELLTTQSGRSATALDSQLVSGAAHFLFWPAVVAIAGLAVLGVSFAHPVILTAALLLILIGGLPHGGYDAALFIRLWGSNARQLALFISVYIAVAACMLLVWNIWPVVALGVFLTLSAVHFGDDWAELPDGLLRICAGAAVIAAPAIGQPMSVTALFVALGGDDAVWLARVALAVAPVVLLVALGAIGIAWNMGQRQRALALLAVLAILLTTPPLIGFALFFALLHAPRHMAMVQRVIDLRHPLIGWSGLGLGVASLLLWWLVVPETVMADTAVTGAWAFQLLSVLVVPHLLCSTWVERQLAQPRPR